MFQAWTDYHDQLRDVDNIVEAGEGDAHQNHSSVLRLFWSFLKSKNFHLKLIDPALVEDGDHLNDIGGIDSANEQVEPVHFQF